MANEAAKKRVIKNREVIGKYRLILLGANVRAPPAHWRAPLHRHRQLDPDRFPVGAAAQALYVLYRVVYLWATFSLWHMGGFALMLAVYGVVWFMLTKAAEPQCARRPAPAQHPRSPPPPSTAAPGRPSPRRPGRARPRGPSPGSKAQRAACVCGRYAPLKDGGALISGGDDLDHVPYLLWLYLLCPTSVTAATRS